MARDETARLRAHRETFQFALARNLSLDAARRELAQERWASVDARLAARRCGTQAPAAEEPSDEGRELLWFQK